MLSLSEEEEEEEEEEQASRSTRYTAELSVGTSKRGTNPMEPIDLGVPEKHLGADEKGEDAAESGRRTPSKGATPFAVSRLHKHSAVMLDTSGDGKVDSVGWDTTGDGVVDSIKPIAEVEELASCDESQLKEMIQSDRDGVYSRQSGSTLRWIIPIDEEMPKQSADGSPRSSTHRSPGSASTPASASPKLRHKRRNSAGSYGSLHRTPPASPMASERSVQSPREHSSGLPAMPSPSGIRNKRGSPNASTHPLPGPRRTRGMESLPVASPEDDEAFKQTRWNFLFYNLNRSVDEIYYLCEQEDHIEEAQEAQRVLQSCIGDFNALVERITLERRIAEGQFPPGLEPTAVAWQIRKSSPDIHLHEGRRAASQPLRSNSMPSSPLLSARYSDTPDFDDEVPAGINLDAAPKGLHSKSSASPRLGVPRKPHSLPSSPNPHRYKEAAPEATSNQSMAHPAPDNSDNEEDEPGDDDLSMSPAVTPPLSPARATGSSTSGSPASPQSPGRWGDEDTASGGWIEARSSRRDRRYVERFASGDSGGSGSGEILQGEGLLEELGVEAEASFGGDYDEDVATMEPSWADRARGHRARPIRDRVLHERLSRDLDRGYRAQPAPRGETARELHREKHEVAEQRKQEIMQEELLRLRAASERVDQVLQLSRLKKEREQQRLDAKIARGASRKEEYLQAVVHKALSENVKVDEVRFIREMDGGGPNFELLDSHVSKTKEAEARREALLKARQQKAIRKNEKIEEVAKLQNKRAQEEAERHERQLMKEHEAEQRRQQAHNQKILNKKEKEHEVQRNKIALEEQKQTPVSDTAERLAAAERRKQAALDEKTSRAAREAQKVAEAQARKQVKQEARVEKYKEKQQEIEQRQERSRSVSIPGGEVGSPPLSAKTPEELAIQTRGSPSHLGRERPQSVAKQTVPPPSPPEAHEKSRAKKAKKARQQLSGAIKEYVWREPEASSKDLERVPSSDKLPSRVHELIRQLEKKSIEGLEAVCYEIGHLIEVPEGCHPDNCTADHKKKAQVMRKLGGLTALATICERTTIEFPTPKLLQLAIKAIYNALLPCAENRRFFLVEGHALLLMSLLAADVELNDKALSMLLGANICLLQTAPIGSAEMIIKELTISAAVYGGTLTFVRQLLSRHASALHTLAPAEGERKRSRGNKKKQSGSKKEDLFGVNVLQQCVYFSELITAYSEHKKGDVGQSYDYGGAVVEGMQDSGIGGLLSLLSAIVVEIGDKSAGMNLTPPLVAVVITALSTLNNMAELDLECIQTTLGSPGFQGEVLHIFGSLLSTCNRHLAVGPDVAPKRKEITVLVHEIVLLVGFYAVTNEPNQDSLSYGTRSIITALCDLPFGYFMHPHLTAVLFPTLIAATHGCERNYRILTQELSPVFLAEFLENPPTKALEELGDDCERFSIHRRFPASACAAALRTYGADEEAEAASGSGRKGGPCAADELVFEEILSGAVA